MGKDIQSLHGNMPLDASDFGARAARLSAMAIAGADIPNGFALSITSLQKNPDSVAQNLFKLLNNNAKDTRFVIRASPLNPSWGGPAAIVDLNIEELNQAVIDMCEAWMRPTAKILRTASGAPEDAGLGLIVQEMVEGTPDVLQAIDSKTGIAITADLPDALKTYLSAATEVLADAAAIEFVATSGGFKLINIMPAVRERRAEIQVVVVLVGSGVLSEEEALLRIDGRSLVEHLHPQIETRGKVEIICQGIAASAGAAQGEIVFTAEAAQACYAQGTEVILVRSETMPEDIRGMHSAAGVLTSTGGTSSHAAVIAQGIGVPCVVGASDLKIDAERKTLTLRDGQVLGEGDLITLNGTDGSVMRGALELRHSALSPAFKTLMNWADKTRAIGVRANADTLREAETAKRFLVDGIGLTRTEHMFYEGDRINVMREMILAEDMTSRLNALERLLPMQRSNFVELFEIMEGAPVTIRLLDPPLHEFLPKGAEDIDALAQAMGLEPEVLRLRIEGMQEFNPMLGKRGVRLAVTMPEIYEMQARAIFEAAAIAQKAIKKAVKPQIMIPLVSAQKEVELVKRRIEAVAKDLEKETGTYPQFELGVMVETPRAALRAGDLAEISSFLSFGTNDLTQMTYGLSRDDAGRFMREYVNSGVYPEDPFLTLDIEGVGELLLTAAKRGRASNKQLELGLCGEHGGDPASVRFCMVAGFDYVSCSPFRVPIARLAAAQATILSKRGGL